MVKIILIFVSFSLVFISCKNDMTKEAYAGSDSTKVKKNNYACDFEYQKSDEEWQKSLSPEQYKILREKGTERAFNNKYYNNHEKGIYTCAGCGTEIFTSETKYESGSGWPSFYAPLAEGKVMLQKDDSYGMERTEVICSKCGGHLGHLFDDGPEPTGLRYCINSASLNFVKK